MLNFITKNYRLPMLVLAIAVLITGIAYYGVSTQAQDPLKLDLDDYSVYTKECSELVID